MNILQQKADAPGCSHQDKTPGQDEFLNKWCWENWVAIWKKKKKIKSDSHLTPYIKIKSKWIINLNIKK